eukprot:CAMPEP_0172502132 /NCGR_PEP_ID=MMETSP1066-20121228/157010_1 /TAXON_ID=671091 /ORGANISM="Coscinodiscus wailesii, Strain CCMP2513" /LENGTH=229 /DNA_ID=CAMNT_0013277277 /DNA_START=29 /DNA_END=718 /DNA_ORIENTATION=+
MAKQNIRSANMRDCLRSDNDANCQGNVYKRIAANGNGRKRGAKTSFLSKEDSAEIERLARHDAIKELIKDKNRWIKIKELLRSKDICTNMAAKEALMTLFEDSKGPFSLSRTSANRRCMRGEAIRSLDIYCEDDDENEDDEGTLSPASTGPLQYFTNLAKKKLFELFEEEEVQVTPKQDAKRVIYLKSIRHIRVRHNRPSWTYKSSVDRTSIALSLSSISASIRSLTME